MGIHYMITAQKKHAVNHSFSGYNKPNLPTRSAESHTNHILTTY